MNLLRQVQLAAIVPVRSMVGKLDNLRFTLHSCAGLPIKIIIVHDDANDGTEEELKQQEELSERVVRELLKIENTKDLSSLAQELRIQLEGN